jgi:UDP-N-acetylglucosamine--N-acetylmuramyl-(pentapeptide) pyrophosphoryl-undecaprenol N-acetylglucosamine transferase
VIFVTVGSNPTFRFDRLIEAVAQLEPQELVVQHGPATPPPGVTEAHQWLTFDQVLDFMGQADAVVSHAGTGTIICAAQMGHVPVVMPRLQRFGETVDDHQVALATVFERTGRVAVVWDAAKLPEHVAQSSKRASPAKQGDGNLQKAIHSALREAREPRRNLWYLELEQRLTRSRGARI